MSPTYVKWTSVLVDPKLVRKHEKDKGRQCHYMRTPAKYTGYPMAAYVQTDSPHKTPTKKKGIPVRRNPGRMDREKWKSKSFICSLLVDDGRTTAEDALEEIEGTNEWPREERIRTSFETGIIPEHPDWPRERRMEVSLLDMARPAKLTGIARNFEIIEAPSKVIVFDDLDECDRSGSWNQGVEEWEEIYSVDLDGGNSVHKGRRMYSAVLQGNGS